MYWNKGAYRAAGFENPPGTWEDVVKAARALKAQGHACPIAIDFDSWQHWEQFSAIHNLPVATRENGFFSPVAPEIAAALSDLDGRDLAGGERALIAEISARLEI